MTGVGIEDGLTNFLQYKMSYPYPGMNHIELFHNVTCEELQWSRHCWIESLRLRKRQRAALQFVSWDMQDASQYHQSLKSNSAQTDFECVLLDAGLQEAIRGTGKSANQHRGLV